MSDSCTTPVSYTHLDVYKRQEQLGIGLEVTDSAREHLIDKGYDDKYGARPLRRTIQNLVEDRMAEELSLIHIFCGRYSSMGDGILDMSGPGADYSYHSTTTNLVIFAERTNEKELDLSLIHILLFQLQRFWAATHMWMPLTY